MIHKLGLLGMIAALLIAVPLVMQLQQAIQQMDKAQAELHGLTPVKHLVRVVQLSQQHRELSANVLSGNLQAEPDRASRQRDVDAAMQQFTVSLEAMPEGAGLTTDWRTLADQWRALSAGVSSRSLTGAQSKTGHTELITALIELNDRLADLAGLSFDSDPTINHLVKASIDPLPNVTEALGLMRAGGSVMLANRQASPAQLAELSGLLDRGTSGMRDVRLLLDQIFTHDERVRAALAPILDTAVTAIEAVKVTTGRELLTATSLGMDSAVYFKLTTEAIDKVYALIPEVNRLLDDLLHERLAATRLNLWAMVSGMSLLTAIGLWVGYAISRSIVEPVQHAREVALRIASGDLTGRVDVRSTDEVGQLLGAMNDMQNALTRVVASVRDNSELVAAASAQIAHGNQDLSDRTEELAASLQQTAMTMNQLGTTVQQNADHASEASGLAGGASEVAVNGGAVVDEVVNTMRDIKDSSTKISEIISVIDAIAFQTNILALNAAVEAARAGEQGRGFAVVAAEVRTLSQRTTEAARGVSQLINTSVERVEHGNMLVDKAGNTMKEVVGAIQAVTAIMAEISTASSMQSANVHEVGEAVARMDETTQQNTALVEESAAAAESLRRQAGDLVQSVSVFKLG